MAATLATFHFLGGKSLSQPELDQVCNLLNISPPPAPHQFPTGDECTYLLVLSTNSPVPDSSGDPSKPLMKLMKDG